VDTKKPVGDIPHFREMTEFFKDKKKQPKDRSTLIHGDYKIDNLVFHKTEPRVIGILDWEMATIGHPLSDLVNLTGPWTWTSKSTPALGKAGQSTTKVNEFDEGVTPGLPTLQEVVNWYISDSGYDAAPELKWGNAFGAFRNSVIMQGIAARYARRQASGTTAKNYGEQMVPYGEYAFGQVQALQQTTDGKTKAKL
jgi:aminoglycoside phosphotransferase (APT) family kinase protein